MPISEKTREDAIAEVAEWLVRQGAQPPVYLPVADTDSDELDCSEIVALWFNATEPEEIVEVLHDIFRK